MKKVKRKFKKQPKVKSSGVKIPKKYTNKDSGNGSQTKRMANEIKKFKGTKKGEGSNPYFQWSGDTDSKTGKRYKTKVSKATLAYNKMFKKKK